MHCKNKREEQTITEALGIDDFKTSRKWGKFRSKAYWNL